MSRRDADTYLYASVDAPNISWLLHALERGGEVVQVMPGTDFLDERIGTLNPRAVFIDFSGRQSPAASDAVRHLRRGWPSLPMLATGASCEPADVLSALRAGVDDFVDTSAPVQEIWVTLTELLQRRGAREFARRGRTVALLGARAGLGATTLAATLALLLQDAATCPGSTAVHAVPGAAGAAGEAGTTRGSGIKTTGAPPMSPSRRDVAMLDLGLPARDGLLYLDTRSDFSFVDAVHSLSRLDETLVHTAIARHDGGAAVLSLPSSLAQVRGVSHTDSAALIKRLADFFSFQIVDFGGFSNADFVAQTVHDADKTWVLCDQSFGAIASTAEMLRDLRARGTDLSRFGLVMNMFDHNVAMSAHDVAARLQIPLRHVIPMRRTALLAAASRGEMLVRTARHDPYVVAVQGMVKALQHEYAEDVSVASACNESPWHAFMWQLVGERKAARNTSGGNSANKA